jgi:hypothetical protein
MEALIKRIAELQEEIRVTMTRLVVLAAIRARLRLELWSSRGGCIMMCLCSPCFAPETRRRDCPPAG